MILMIVINTGFRASKSFWQRSGNNFNYFGQVDFFKVYGLETELGGLAAEKLMHWP